MTHARPRSLIVFHIAPFSVTAIALSGSRRNRP
jgi:hypothetical protein